MKYYKFIFYSMILALFISACATPKAVKQLSSEIVEVNVKYQNSLESYFVVIEKFVDDQISIAEFLIGESDRKIEGLERKKAKKLLQEENADIDNILIDFEKNIKSNASQTAAGMQRLNDLSQQLKAKHNEMLVIQSNIVTAQKKLDEYVQLEKADEAVVGELLGVVGGQMEKLTGTIGDISGIFNKISGITDSLKN